MFENYDIYDRSRVTLHVVVQLLSPLSHIGEVSGNVSNLKTLKMLDIEGQPRQCFVYSGNALRNGLLRRRGVASALESLGIDVNPDVHHTMFAGGRIDGSTASDMELDKKIRQLMPWLSVLGTAKPVNVFGSKNAQMIPGRLNVGSAYLACYESAEYLYNQFPNILPPESLEGIAAIAQAKADILEDPFSKPDPGAIAAYKEAKVLHLPYLRKVLRSWTEYIAVDQTTRRDSTHDPALQKFLPESARALLSGDADDKGKDKKKSDQMISSDRLVMAGSKLYSRWDLNTTAVEEGFVYDALSSFSEFPYLGGKGQRGNGLVSIDIWYQSGSENGHLATIGGQSNDLLCDRFVEKRRRYQDHIETFKGFLSEAKESSELRSLLNAAA